MSAAQPNLSGLALSDYYMRAPLYEPPQFVNREFAFIKNGTMYRHLAFTNVQKLRAALIKLPPEHVYFSSAKYEYPAIDDMSAKKRYWQNSDLVFDVDFDKLKTPTLQEAKRQSLKLIRILHRDFGLQDLMWVFSGSRGYHVHVRDACIQSLGNAERREIADYFCEFVPGRKHKDGTPIANRKHVRIDVPVTGDVTRLIRLPGSIHGKTGLACEILPLPEVKD